MSCTNSVNRPRQYHTFSPKSNYFVSGIKKCSFGKNSVAGKERQCQRYSLILNPSHIRILCRANFILTVLLMGRLICTRDAGGRSCSGWPLPRTPPPSRSGPDPGLTPLHTYWQCCGSCGSGVFIPDTVSGFFHPGSGCAMLNSNWQRI